MKRRYATVMRLLSLAAPIWLAKRAKGGKEDKARLNERYGKTNKTRPAEQLIWMHGASVGETKMMMPLIKKLLSTNPNRHVLVTSGTVTSAELMAKTLPDRAFHQYVPFDAPHFVARFLDHWKPDLAIWAESEIWPNLVSQTKAAHIPMALINARMSQKSLDGWQKRRRFANAIFGCFDIILPADAQTATELSKIIGEPLRPAGNLKYDAPPLSFANAERVDLKTAWGQRPLWVAASIHAEEMDIIIQAHRHQTDRHKANRHQTHEQSEAALILVPRHPSDAASRMIVADHPDLTFARRSRGEIPKAETDIYLFDTLGEMGLAYSLADLALVGGSLSPELMGHNPLEPIRLNVPTLTGPYFASFAEVYAPYIKEKAVLCIEDVSDLPQIIMTMLNAPEDLQALTTRAAEIIDTLSGSLDVTSDALEGLL